jgi:hypothetical protein
VNREEHTTKGWVAILRWLCRAGKVAVSVATPAAAVVAVALPYAPDVLTALGFVLVVASAIQVFRARVRGNLAAYRGHQDILDAIEQERRVAARSLIAAVVLAAAPLCAPPIAVAVVGLVAVGVMAAAAIWAAGKSVRLQDDLGLGRGMAYINLLPAVVTAKDRAATAPTVVVARWFIRAFGDGRSAGEIGTHLARTLGAMLIVGLAYVAVGMACVGSAVVKDVTRDKRPGAGPTAGGGARHSGGAPSRPVEKDVSYAKQCPQLPDPLAIGHGLGELFYRAGATQAGCGEQAEQVAPGVWISRGECAGDLRSLAVVASGLPPIMLYGEPADFAEAIGQELRGAERAQPAGGDVALVTTTQGTFTFTRSTPALRPAISRAHRCTEVSEPARPFVRLLPAMGELWSQYVRRFGWAWPTSTSAGDDALRDLATDAIVATGGCDTTGTCHLDAGQGIHWTMVDAPVLSMAALRPAMP